MQAAHLRQRMLILLPKLILACSPLTEFSCYVERPPQAKDSPSGLFLKAVTRGYGNSVREDKNFEVHLQEKKPKQNKDRCLIFHAL